MKQTITRQMAYSIQERLERALGNPGELIELDIPILIDVPFVDEDGWVHDTVNAFTSTMGYPGDLAKLLRERLPLLRQRMDHVD